MRAYSTKYFSSSTSSSFHFVALFFIASLVLVSCRSLLAPNLSTPHVCHRGLPTSSLGTEKRRVSILHDEGKAPSPTAFAYDNLGSREFNEVYLSPSINLLDGTKSLFHII